MKKLLQLEAIGEFILSIVLFSQLGYRWWIFPLLILLPDLSMIGYLFGTKPGAICYNIFHHKLLAVLIFAVGYGVSYPPMILAGIILFGHAAMDRIFGYGLKYNDDFKHTHLGWMGPRNEKG